MVDNKKSQNEDHDSDDLFSLDSNSDIDKKDEQIVNNIIKNYELKKSPTTFENNENTIRLSNNNNLSSDNNSNSDTLRNKQKIKNNSHNYNKKTNVNNIPNTFSKKSPTVAPSAKIIKNHSNA